MKKRIIVIVLVLAAAGGIFGKKWYERVNQENAEDTLKIYGTIDIRDANLAFIEQERITEVLVEEGERVTKGKVLARLKTNRIEAAIQELSSRIAAQNELVNLLKTGNRPQEIEQAKAEVEAAQAQAANSRLLLTRLEQTTKSGASSKQAVDDARSRFEVEKAQLKVRKKALNLMIEGPRQEDIASAEHQLEALQANLGLLKIRLADMTLTAPSPGIIQSRILEPGEMAGPNRAVFTLALNDPKWVRAYVPEPHLGRIKMGMKAKVLSDSFPAQPIEGTIGFISSVAEFTPRAVQTEDLRTKLVYEVRVIMPDPQDRLRLGMPVTVIVEETTKQNNSVSSLPPKSKPATDKGA